MALMSIKNLTIGFWIDGFTIDIDYINNKIIGHLGKFIDSMYVHKNRRDCILKSVKHFQDVDHNNNESFFRLSKLDLVDIYYFPMKNRFSSTPEYLEITKIVSTTPYQLGQFIPKPSNFQTADLSSFLFNNINLLLIILTGYLLITLSFFVFSKLINRTIKIKFFNLLSLNYNQLYFLSFKLLKLFFNLFLFINLIHLISSIKTDKVIVKTDEFLNTDEKLLKSSKKFVYDYFSEDNYRLSPKSSLIFKLYQKKVYIEKNYLNVTTKFKQEYSSFINEFLTKKLSSFFIIEDRFVNLLYFTSLSRYSKDDEFIYLNDQNYFEISALYYFRKSLNEDIKKTIHWSTNQYFENGFYLDLLSKAHNEIYKLIKNNGISIIFNLSDYISQQSVISSLEIKNFQNIFYSYVLILIFIFLIFLINSFYKQFKNIIKIQYFMNSCFVSHYQIKVKHPNFLIGILKVINITKDISIHNYDKRFHFLREFVGPKINLDEDMIVSSEDKNLD